MQLTELNAISPIDGRYRSKTVSLSAYFSEEALIKYRVLVEVEYFIALCEANLPQLEAIEKSLYPELRKIYTEFTKNTSISIADKNQITEKLRQIINPIRNSGEIKQQDSSRSKIVLNYYKWYIDFYSNNNSPNTGRVLSTGTVKTYRNAMRFLKDYLKFRNIKNY